jgi:hypothetical protein
VWLEPNQVRGARAQSNRLGGGRDPSTALRYVISALSLNAVNNVQPTKSGSSVRIDRTGAIHHPCSPPWMTRPARKKPTNNGVLKSESGDDAGGDGRRP